MKKYASFVEMNMIRITIPKAQLLPIVTRITKPWTHFHPAPSTSIQLILASTQLSATPSPIFEPKYRT